VAEKNTIFKGFEKGELKTNGSFAKKYDIWLVVWNIFLFLHILGTIILTDELIFFRGVGIPPTRTYFSPSCLHLHSDRIYG